MSWGPVSVAAGEGGGGTVFDDFWFGVAEIGAAASCGRGSGRPREQQRRLRRQTRLHPKSLPSLQWSEVPQFGGRHETKKVILGYETQKGVLR